MEYNTFYNLQSRNIHMYDITIIQFDIYLNKNITNWIMSYIKTCF